MGYHSVYPKVKCSSPGFVQGVLYIQTHFVQEPIKIFSLGVFETDCLPKQVKGLIYIPIGILGGDSVVAGIGFRRPAQVLSSLTHFARNPRQCRTPCSHTLLIYWRTHLAGLGKDFYSYAA